MKNLLLYLILIVSLPALGQVTDAAMKTQADYIGTHTFDPSRTKTLDYDLINNKVPYVGMVTASGTNTYTYTGLGAFTSIPPGFSIDVKFPNDNTGASTFNINSTTTYPLVKGVSTPLVAGDIKAGKGYRLYFDGTSYQMSVTGAAGSTGDVQLNLSGSTDATANFNYNKTNNRLIIGGSSTNAQGSDNFTIGLGNVISVGSQGFVISESGTIERTSGAKGVSDNAIFGGYLGKITTTSAHFQTGSFSNFIGAGINNQIFDGTTSFIGAGRYNIASNESASVLGEDAHATGYASFAHGYFDRSTIPLPPIAAASRPVIASGTGSFNFSANNGSQTVGHGAQAKRSSILNCMNCDIPTTGIGSAIIGGFDLSESDSSTVQVPNLRIGYKPVINDTITHVLVIEDATGKIKRRNVSSISGGSSVTSVTGTTNRITSSGGTTPAIDISASYVGQTSITTLGTIGTGVWNGTGVDVAHGGSGVTSLTAYAPIFGGTTSTGPVQAGTVGTAGQVLTSNGAGALPTFQAAPVTLTGAITYTGVISPTILSTNQNNYAPTGLSGAYTIKQNVSGNVDITGLTGGTDGRLINLINTASIGSGSTITLKNSNAGSTSANRFLSSGDTYIPAGGNVILQYDGTASRWKIASSLTYAGEGMTLSGNVLSLGGLINSAATIDFSSTAGSTNFLTFAPNSGTGSEGSFALDMLSFDASHNSGFSFDCQTGSISLYGGPLSGITSITIDTDGNILMPVLPTSCSGKPAGTIVNVAGVLNVCP